MDLTSQLRNFFANRAGSVVKAIQQVPQEVSTFGQNLMKTVQPEVQQVQKALPMIGNAVVPYANKIGAAIGKTPLFPAVPIAPLAGVIKPPTALQASQGLSSLLHGSPTSPLSLFLQGKTPQAVQNNAEGFNTLLHNMNDRQRPGESNADYFTRSNQLALNFMLNGAAPEKTSAKALNEAVQRFRIGLEGLPELAGKDINKTIVDTLVGHLKGQRLTGNQQIDELIRHANFIDAAKNGATVNAPWSMGLATQDIRQGQKMKAGLYDTNKEVNEVLKRLTTEQIGRRLSNAEQNLASLQLEAKKQPVGSLDKIIQQTSEELNIYKQAQSQAGLPDVKPQKITLDQLAKEASQYPNAGNFGAVAGHKYGLSFKQSEEIWNKAHAPQQPPLTPGQLNNVIYKDIPESPLPGQPPTPPSGKPPTPEPEGLSNPNDPFFNVKRVGVTPEQQAALKQTVIDTKPEITQTVGDKLSHKEVADYAERIPNVLKKTITREQTLELGAQALNLRNKVAEMASKGRVTPEFLDALIKDKAMGQNIARLLGQRSIVSDPAEKAQMQQVLEAVLKKNENTDQILKAAEGVDFNNANQAADFYRQFVKPKVGDYVDLLRYNSMLSSPNTHINNAFSNVLNTGVVAPVEKTLTGAIDFLSSKALGKQQTQFSGEGAAYIKGYYSKLGEAAHRFAAVVKGERANTNLDLRSLSPLHGQKGDAFFSMPMRLLEASDQFFTALTEGGEKSALQLRESKGIHVPNMEVKATQNAAYRLYRSELHDKRQGTLLNSVDDLTGKIQALRTSDNKITSTIASFTIPFIRTPMNIFKQMLEYSPTGLATIPGASNKTEQLSKAILGTAGIVGAMQLVTSGRTTWAEPTNPTQKAAFRAAGMQPYAVKIGDNWVAYNKLPPAMSVPLAMTSALYEAQQNRTLDQNQVDAVLSGFAKVGNFFSDQSYLKNIGDMIAATKGDTEGMARFVGNYPQQLVPYRALMGWMARLVDPYQRKVDTDAGVLQQQVEQLLTQIPFASGNVPARLDAAGNPIPNQNREVNALSPLKITTERPEAKQMYDLQRQASMTNKNLKAAENMIMRGEEPDFSTIGQASAAEEAPKKNIQEDLVKQAKDKIAIKQAQTKAKLTGEDQVAGDKLYHFENGKITTVNLNTDVKAPELTGNPVLDKRLKAKYKTEITAAENSVLKQLQLGRITDEEAAKMIDAIEGNKNVGLGSGGGQKAKKGRLKVNFLKGLNTKPIKVSTRMFIPKPVTVKAPRLSSPKLSRFSFTSKQPKLKKTKSLSVLKRPR